MKALIQKIQMLIERLRDNFENKPRYYKALLLYFLLPCHWIGRIRWIPSIIKLFLDIAALYIALCVFLLGGFVVCSLWYMWKYARLFILGKIAVSVLGVACIISFASYVVNDTSTPSQPLDSENTATSQIESNTVNSESDTSSEPDTSAELEIPATVESDPEPVQEVETPYDTLAQSEDDYLLFLRIIGTCYKDNSLTDELFAEMEEFSNVQAQVEDVLNYRYNNGGISPDFLASFSAFWTDDVAAEHPEVKDALQVSFDLEYNLVDKVWTLKENEATVEANVEDDFEWLPATGHLYVGVDLYIVTDDTITHYGTITALTNTDVEIYLTASDEAQWFGRRIPMISKVLKVRSDDTHLPKY